MNFKKLDNFLFGFIPGLIVPAIFLWVYISQTYESERSIVEIIKFLFPSPLMGKMLMLSIMPNLAAVFLFYRQDTFKIAAGILGGAMFYLIPCFFML